jgi:hypothetical protein
MTKKELLELISDMPDDQNLFIVSHNGECTEVASIEQVLPEAGYIYANGWNKDGIE